MTGRGHARATAPAHRRPTLILLVFLGGAIGAAAREALTIVLPAPDGGVPWAILVANLSGAFLLGLLLTVLGVHAVETRARRDLRLFLGTGLLGGFTTYSSLAVGGATLLEGDPWLGAAYALGTVVAGLVAAALGVWLGGALTARRVAEGEPR
jgi:CrcB protein